jgi:DNA polymerase-3 subunit beta
MKFTIGKTEFLNALNIVQKGVTTRSTMPVLSGILLTAQGDNLVLEATDLEKSIKFIADALIEESGRTVIPAKIFIDIVKSMPDAAIHVSTDGVNANIQCENSSFMIKVLNSDDFPAFPEINEEESIELDFDQFSDMVKRVSKSVSRDESRMILTGIFLEVSDGVIRMVSTDSYRLAVAEATYTGNNESEFTAVIDGQFMTEIASLSPNFPKIVLMASENQILISYGKTTFINRRIEGTYPNYKQLIPQSFDTVVDIDKEELLQGSKRASLLCTKNSPLKLSVSNQTKSVCISVNALDLGAVQETIICGVDGEDLEVAYNSIYFIDGLGVFKSEKISLYLQEYPKPGIIKSEEDPGFLYLVMPMRN